jgi:hypothetical protein
MDKQQDIEVAKAALAAAEAEPEADTAWLEAAPGLDKSRPYGTVMDGSGVSKARYQQDGKFYAYDGALIKE